MYFDAYCCHFQNGQMVIRGLKIRTAMKRALVLTAHLPMPLMRVANLLTAEQYTIYYVTTITFSCAQHRRPCRPLRTAHVFIFQVNICSLSSTLILI